MDVPPLSYLKTKHCPYWYCLCHHNNRPIFNISQNANLPIIKMDVPALSNLSTTLSILIFPPSLQWPPILAAMMRDVTSGSRGQILMTSQATPFGPQALPLLKRRTLSLEKWIYMYMTKDDYAGVFFSFYPLRTLSSNIFRMRISKCD